jgi:hypothetical protein
MSQEQGNGEGHGEPVPLGPGSEVADYLIEKEIGAGRMARVYRAREEALGRVVALKVMSPELAADHEFRDRFLRESRSVAGVAAPHVIPVYGAGEANGTLYIATRYVAGGDLADLVRRNGGFLSPQRAAELISQVASALDAAHAAGLVHGDVTLSSILVDATPGRPEHAYLTDFGLARAVRGATGLSATSQFATAPGYCAPEQVTRGLADSRTDQYALGCAAFALLTGFLPYQRPQPAATLFAHMNDPVPQPSAARPGIPAAVDAVVARAMAKSPAARYASCGEFATALRDALTATFTQPPRYGPVPGSGPAPGYPPPAAGPRGKARDWFRRKTVLIAGGVAVLLLAAAGAGVSLSLSGAATISSASAGVSLQAAGYTTIPGWQAFSPDNKTLVSQEFSVGTTPGDLSVEDDYFVWNTMTGQHVKTLTLPAGYNAASAPAFSPDGTTVTALGQDFETTSDFQVFRWNLSTGSRRTLLSVSSPDKGDDGSAAFVTTSLSGDGSTLIVAADASGSSTDVYDVATGDKIAVLANPGSASVVGTTIDYRGDKVSMSDSDGLTFIVNSRSGTSIGNVRSGQKGVLHYAYHAATGDNTPDHPFISPDGTKVEMYTASSTIIWNAANGNLITPGDPRWPRSALLDFSDDGRYILTAPPGNETSFDIWNGGTLTHVLTVHLPHGNDAVPYTLSWDDSELVTGAINSAGTTSTLYIWHLS